MASKKAPAAAQAPGTVTDEVFTYVATTPILHDGDTYQPGDEMVLTADQAKRLGNAVTAPDANLTETSKE